MQTPGSQRVYGGNDDRREAVVNVAAVRLDAVLRAVALKSRINEGKTCLDGQVEIGVTGLDRRNRFQPRDVPRDNLRIERRRAGRARKGRENSVEVRLRAEFDQAPQDRILARRRPVPLIRSLIVRP